MCRLPVLIAALLPLLGACGTATSDEAYARQKCRDYGPERSAAYQACAGEVIYWLHHTQRFRTFG